MFIKEAISPIIPKEPLKAISLIEKAAGYYFFGKNIDGRRTSLVEDSDEVKIKIGELLIALEDSILQ